MSDVLRSPVWSGLVVVVGMLVVLLNNGAIVVGFLFVVAEVGWRISSKKFAKK